MTTMPHWMVDLFILIIAMLSFSKARDDHLCGQKFAMVIDVILGIGALFVVFGMPWK